MVKLSGAMVKTTAKVYQDDYEWAMRYAFNHHTSVDAIIRKALADFRAHAIVYLVDTAHGTTATDGTQEEEEQP